jgi:ABC-type molybdate transport system substrate-binding protein
MFTSYAQQMMLGAASAALLMASPLEARSAGKTNINLAVASNFYGVPPSNSAITDLINAFEADNPTSTVTVVDNGATATLESHIINGNTLNVDLFLAADTATPEDLLSIISISWLHIIPRFCRRYTPLIMPRVF